MNTVKILTVILCLLWFQGCDFQKQEKVTSPENILLKDFKPVSKFKIPITKIQKAKYPVIDMHTHGSYVKTSEEVDQWVKVMDETGVAKAIVLTGLNYGVGLIIPVMKNRGTVLKL